MKIVGGMATYHKRKHTRGEAIDSIKNQLDFLLVSDNSESDRDRTDNAKFLILEKVKQPSYVFLLDDDLIYPQDYVEKTIEAIEEYGCIITHHGRRLLGEGKDYYNGHDGYRCLDAVKEALELDVAGTGVTAFRSDYFHPEGLADSPLHRMSDLVFSLEAARQGKRIGIIPHNEGWITHINNDEQIYKTESKLGTPIQNYLADEIFRTKHK